MIVVELDNLIEYLQVTNKASTTGPMKMRLHNNSIVAYVILPCVIYELPVSFGDKLKALATN